MERLTRKMPDGRFGLVEGKELGTVRNNRAVIDRLGAYEDTGLEPEQVLGKEDTGKVAMCLLQLLVYQALGPSDELRELVQAEKAGRLVQYVPGDIVYDRFGMEWAVTSSEIHRFDGPLRYLYRCGHPGTNDYCALYADEILTREEAEVARKAWERKLQETISEP